VAAGSAAAATGPSEVTSQQELEALRLLVHKRAIEAVAEWADGLGMLVERAAAGDNQAIALLKNLDQRLEQARLVVKTGIVVAK